MVYEWLILLLALLTAMSMRPWRLLIGGQLLSPLLGVLVVVPWFWALPRLHAMPLQLQFSGACAVTLMLGWPLAIPVLTTVTVIGALIAPTDWDALVVQAVWHGIVPASLALGAGIFLRVVTGNKPFVYILGRAFAVTVLSTFAAGYASQFSDYGMSHGGLEIAVVARWLLAWGDGFVTGMLAAVFVAFHPEWLATWSDRLYLGTKG